MKQKKIDFKNLFDEFDVALSNVAGNWVNAARDILQEEQKCGSCFVRIVR